MEGSSRNNQPAICNRDGRQAELAHYFSLAFLHHVPACCFFVLYIICLAAIIRIRINAKNLNRKRAAHIL